MNNVINHLITTTYTSNRGVLTSKKWDDGSMRHHTLVYQGERNGRFVTIRWVNVSIFAFDGEEVYFVARRADGTVDEKAMKSIVNVETK